MYHYVYKLECQKTGDYYFGSRTSKVHPSIDPYLGSMLSWKPNKFDLVKTILQSDFQSRTEATQSEALLIETHIEDSRCKNAHIPNKSFHTTGLGQYKDTKGKVHRTSPTDERVLSGELTPFWSGRVHTKKSKLKMSLSAKSRQTNPETEGSRRKNISTTLSGIKKTDTHRQNISQSKLGSKNPMAGKKQKRVVCDKCKKEVAVNVAKRFHFEKCKI
jgi:hypothetical protein